MKKRLQRIQLWIRRRSSLPLIVVGGVIIAVLFFNDDISIKDNVKYENTIRDLQRQIKLNQDSAVYFRQKYEAVARGGEDLERIAREQYHMQRPTEDIYLVNEKD